MESGFDRKEPRVLELTRQGTQGLWQSWWGVGEELSGGDPEASRESL